MNWLAHIVLSENDIDFQLGNVLADPFKGEVWPQASQAYVNGIIMHKSIDVFTDTHPLVSKSKSRLGERGYLKPVIIDIAYDMLLTRHWDEYINVSYHHYLDHFYHEARAAVKTYPASHQRFVNGLLESNNLRRYGTFEGLTDIFGSINRRLSTRLREKESAVDYVAVLKNEINNIETDFNVFFPELIQHVLKDACKRKYGHLKQ